MEDTGTSTYVNDDDTNYLVDDILPPSRRGGYHIEPIVFLMALSGGLFDTILPNVIESQYCTAHLHRPASDCLVNSTVVPQTDIQTFTSTLQMIRTSIEVTIPCILSFFFGPWSDKYGRRPLLISAGCGYFLNSLLWAWGSTMPSLSPIYFLSFSVPYGFSGSTTFLYLAAFCYVCDITPIEKRSTRLGLVQASLLLGTLGGVQLGPFIAAKLSYTVVFATAAGFSYLAVMYSYFILPESIVPSEIDLNADSRNPFNFNHVKDLVDACYNKQTPVNRLKISIVMMISTLSLLQISGETGILYLFLQRIVSISLKDFTILVSYAISIGAVATYLIPRIFSQIFRVDDLNLLSFAVFFRLLGALTVVFGYRVWHIYFSRTMNCTLGLTAALTRSYLSRNIHEDQLGKVFSLIASAESSTPVFGALAYTILYNWTVGPFPAAVFLFSGFLLLLQLLFVVFLIELQKPRLSSQVPNPQAPSINA